MLHVDVYKIPEKFQDFSRILYVPANFQDLLRISSNSQEFLGICVFFYFISSCAREFPGFLGNFTNAHFDILFPGNSRDFLGYFVQINAIECKLFPENFSGIVLGKTREFYGFTGISLNNFARQASI